MASKNRRNKVKFKLQPELIVIVACLVIMLVATIIMAIPTKAEKTTTNLNNAIYSYNQQNSSSGSSSSSSSSYLANDNVYEEVSHSSLVKKIRTEEYVYVIYGQYTSNTTIVSNLYYIQSICEDEEIKKVYLYDSTWVDEYEDTDSESFNVVAHALEEDFNKNKSADVEEFDLLVSPALLVFHNGSMVFNSQTYEDESYSWAMFIQKAFYLSQVK
ncbi:MAG: hypothetical protein IKP12_03995 [Acholeplasmatales bacterium]|nr:hypothetical protein [Acholeplasmatales bacterium]